MRALFCALLGGLAIGCMAETSVEPYTYEIYKSSDKITLDGVLSEESWKKASVKTQFFLNKPYDTAYAKLQTEIRLTFDDKFIYVGAKCYQDRNTYRTSSLKRDFEGGISDVFTVNFDTFKDKLNGFHFALNPYNVQREGLIDNGENLSTFWDNKWYSEVTNYHDHWEIEMAIPFSTLRYKMESGENSWRMNFARNILESNEISTWVPIPRNFRPSNIAFSGLLIWKENPPLPSKNISVIPYLSGRYTADYPRDEKNLIAREKIVEQNLAAGLDAKIAVTSSLNLDLTINPDFSQVEVDQQVTNLSRFELFFPERRQFFLENSDLFDRWGFPNTRPFFSRRIGIANNPVTNQNVQVPILAGARLSGKINQKSRIGVINMQTKRLDFGNEKVLPAANYGVVAFQQNVLKRSVLGAILVNKQNLLSNLSEVQRAGFQSYNRIAGLEYNYNSADNKWSGESYYHQSFNPDKTGHTLAQFIGYGSPNFAARLGYMQVGKNYDAQVGFVPRKGVRNLYSGLDLTKFVAWKQWKQINSVGIAYEGSQTFNWDAKLLDSYLKVAPFINFVDQSFVTFGVEHNYTYLFDPFDPANTYLNPNPDAQKNVQNLPIGQYDYWRYFAEVYSSSRSDFSYVLKFSSGSYFNGKNTNIGTQLGYRIQPYGNLQLTANYVDIRFPAPFQSTSYWLVGPKVDFAFTKSLFLSGFWQYNTQTNNVNLNARLQWRFKPVSDLFIVYTDNYFAENIPNYNIQSFSIKNRALVLKVTYWLNT